MTFLENLNWRYAAKSFSGEKIKAEDLQKIKEAIRLAPSSFGVQPFHVVIIENDEKNKDLMTKLKDQSLFNSKQIESCSHLFVFCRKTNVRDRFLKLLEMQKRNDRTFKIIAILLNYVSGFANLGLFQRWTTKNAWTKMQAYLALGFAMSACTELKIDSCPLEGFKSYKYRKILNLPMSIKPTVLLALGTRNENDAGLKYPKTRFSNEDLFSEI